MSLSNDEALQKTSGKTDKHRNQQLAAQSGLKWGKTPSSYLETNQPPSKPPNDHPVHKIPLKKQDEMRRKGINPVLKAEMDEMMGKGQSRGKFWKKYGTTSMGPWMV
jgi:hypothetical protein